MPSARQGAMVAGAIRTQTIEGYRTIFKRGIMGPFHKIKAIHGVQSIDLWD
jgi:hypothetical protein